MLKKDVTDSEKQKEITRLDKLLKNMDDMLKDSNSEYFSGVDEMSVIDIVLHSEISTIIYMYSLKERLSDTEFRFLAPWMNRMAECECISENLLKMKEVIQMRQMYGDFIKSN